MPETIAFGSWLRMALLPRSPGTGSRATPETPARQPAPRCAFRNKRNWTPSETCTSPTVATTSFARSIPMESSRPWPATDSARVHTGNSTGTGAYAGDGGPATKAELNLPVSIAVDPAGDIFISDQGNNVIRKVDLTGKITTVAGISSSFGYAGD